MKKTELLQVAKPILFNTEVVRAILDGRKTVTRRCVKYKYNNTEMKIHTDKYGTRLIEIQKNIEGETYGRNPDGTMWHKLLGYIEPKPPYKKGDYLYIRETWSEWTGGYLYRAYQEPFAQPGESTAMKWHPSIHMPKEAARIFLRVTDVRAERLQDITDEQAKAEGANFKNNKNVGWEEKMHRTAVERFAEIWNFTIPKKDLNKYGWDANPWVWVIEFERVEVERWE